MAERFSIFIPVWNSAEWLPGAIDSVLAQTCSDWELIIGDNASSDDLAGIAAAYPDPRIRYHRWDTHTDSLENFNRTVRLCQFEWVQLLCADDRLHPSCLERMQSRLSDAQSRGARVGFVITAARRVAPDGRVVDREYYGYGGRTRVSDGLHGPADWLRFVAAPGAPPWNVGSLAIAKTVLDEMGTFFRGELGNCSDNEVILRAAAYADGLYIDEPLMDYTVRSDSETFIREPVELSQQDALPPMAGALLAGLEAHESRRAVDLDERRVVYAGVARSYLLRASHHRFRHAGGGWRAAVRDIIRGLRCSPTALASPRQLMYALAVLTLPRVVLRIGRRAALDSLYPVRR